MARYRLKVHKSAARYLERLPAKARKRTRAALDMLTENPRDAEQLDVKPLVNTNGLWRLRIGSVRLVYEILDQQLLVYLIRAGSRGDVYKHLG